MQHNYSLLKPQELIRDIIMTYKSPAILVVDDDEAIRELVRMELSEEGYHCQEASSAEGAYSKLKKDNFDLVLLDIKLPDKSGMEVLKSMDPFSKIKIIMMTAVKDLETAIKAMKLGASDYIVKPFTFEKLKSSIIAALGHKERTDLIGTLTLQSGNPVYRECAHDPSVRKISAIAYGVDAQVDYFDFHSTIVTRRTVDLAKQLGLHDKDINKWVKNRTEFYSTRDKYIRSILTKLEQNPLAQVVLELAQPLFETPDLSGEQN